MIDLFLSPWHWRRLSLVLRPFCCVALLLPSQSDVFAMVGGESSTLRRRPPGGPRGGRAALWKFKVRVGVLWAELIRLFDART